MSTCDHRMGGIKIGNGFTECLRCGYIIRWEKQNMSAASDAYYDALFTSLINSSYPKPRPVENIDLKEHEQMDGQTLASGEKKDNGKPKWELLPFDALEGAVYVLTDGSVRYSPRNWEKGIAYGRVFGALMRHLWKWWMAKVVGETGLDDDSGKSHLDHALCELMFLSAYEKRGKVEFDDRPGK